MINIGKYWETICYYMLLDGFRWLINVNYV